MNQSGIGLIKYNTEKTEFRLFQNPELLNSLGLGPDSTIYGFYYPKPTEKEYDKITVNDDIMLTPIPYYLWDRSARLIIHMEQEEGTLNKITHCLSVNDISIISSKSTRSGYRHATYTLHITFGGLPEVLTEFNDEKEFYIETESRVHSIEDRLRTLLKSENIEPHSETTYGRFEPVIAWANHSLAYFHNYIEKKKKEQQDHTLLEPFPLKLSYENGLPYFHSPILNTIIREINKKENANLHRKQNDEEYKAITFAELDTRTLNIRMAIIPYEQSKSFFELGLEYERSGNPINCKGLIAEITDRFPREYNLWRSYNFTKSNSEHDEKGCLVFLIEDMKPRDSKEEYIKKAKHLVTDDIKPDLRKTHPNINITDHSINPLTNLKIEFLLQKAKERKELVKYPVFISYTHADKEMVKTIERKFREGGITPFMDEKMNEYGSDFSNTIRDALNNCIEMCLIFTPKSKGKEWILTEWGAMWAMGKKITPILIGTVPDELPTRLRNYRGIVFIDPDDHSKGFDELEVYIKQVYDTIQKEFNQEFFNKYGEF